MRWFPERRQVVWFWALVSLVALILAWPVLRPGYALFWGTPLFQFIPWRWLAWLQLREGAFPWWNPYAGLGTPLFANYQTALLYPPTWITLLGAWAGGVAGMAYAHGWVMVLHWLWSAWGMARFARNQGLSPWGAWLSGLVFAFSGYSVARAGIFPSMNAAMSWSPWVLWAVDGLAREPQGRRALVLALVLGMQLLSGHAQTTWYTGVLAASWWLWVRWQHGGRQTLGDARGWIWGALGLGLALLLAAGQLAATGEYTLFSQRSGGLPEEFALQYSFWPWHYLNLLHPRMFGHPATGNVWGYGAAWEDALYLGVLPLLLAGYALFTQARRHRFWWGVLVVTQFLALGWFTPVYPWLYRYIPTFSVFQAPTRWHLLTTVALAYLAGAGLDAWQRPGKKGAYWVRLAVTAAGGTWVTSAFLALTSSDQRLTTLAWGWSAFGFWLMGGLWLWLRAAPGPQFPGRPLLVLLWTALDLMVNQQGWLPVTSWETYVQAPKEVEVARELVGSGYAWLPAEDAYLLLYQDLLVFATFTPPRPLALARRALLPNVNLFDRIPVVNAFDPLLPARYVELVTLLNELPQPARERMLDRLAVRLVVLRDEASPKGVVYRGRSGPPPVQWFSQGEWVPDSGETLEYLRAAALQGGPVWTDRLRLAGEGVPLPDTNASEARDQARVHFRRQLTGAWEIQVEAPRAGFLLVVQNAYPGWQAWVNGQPVRWYRAEHSLMAVPVPPGQVEVRLVYRPSWAVRVAMAWQALTWVGMGIWFVWDRRISSQARLGEATLSLSGRED